MRPRAIALALVLLRLPLMAASPDPPPEASIATFRAETAEVHIALSAFDKHDQPVTNLDSADFTLSRDGQPLQQAIRLVRRQDAPISTLVMTDVSYSMEKAVPMARTAWQWMDANLLVSGDQVHYLDFGAQIDSKPAPESPHLTSLYDCLLKSIPQVTGNSAGRRTLILFTDGIDNNSSHALEDVIRLAVAKDVAVYAITTWKYKINYDWQVLDSLTSATGGRYFVVKNSKEMIASLKEIEQELRNGYEVVFRADPGSAGFHRISVRATYRKLRFYHRGAYYQPANSRIGTMAALR